MKLALTFCLLASPLVAECPVPVDMGRGVRLISDDGGSVSYTRLDDIRVRVIDEDARLGSQSTLAYGLYILDEARLVRGVLQQDSYTQYAFPLAVEDMPAPTPLSQHDWVSTWDYRGVPQQEQVFYNFGAVERTQIGACYVDVMVVTFAFDGAAQGYLDYYFYLPEFGFAYYAGFRGGDGKTILTRITSFEAIEK